MLLLALSAAWATCTPAQLDSALDAVEAGYVAGDAESVRAGLREARATARCAGPTAAQAARVHRSRGLVKALEADWEGVREDFRASAAAHPLLAFPDALQTDQRLHLAWQRAQEGPMGWSFAPTASVNGVTGRLQPDARKLASGGRTPARGMRVASAALGVVSAGTFGLSWLARDGYDFRPDDQVQLDQAIRQRRLVNGLAVGSFASGVFAVGLLGASFTF